LGHAPFGHVGERALDELTRDYGGFIHEVHGLRVVDKIARDGNGLNLTYAVRDGIVSHCGEEFSPSIRPNKKEKELDSIMIRQSAPLTYEGCVVHVADKIAYLGRDIEDAIAIGLITKNDIPVNVIKSLGTTNGEIIDTLVLDIVKHSLDKEEIVFSDSKFELIYQLKEFNYARIYNHPSLLKSDNRISNLLKHLFDHLLCTFKKGGFDARYYQKCSIRVDRHFGHFMIPRKHLYKNESHPQQCVIDFVAGMTDSFALESAREVIFPKSIDLA
jgi:dGTPase